MSKFQGKHLSSRAHPPRSVMGKNQIQKKPQSSPRKSNMKMLPNKRMTVKNSYYALREVFHEFNIPCVKRVSGTGIIRICCRTFEQLDNITLIMKQLLEVNLIKEIGMPLEYAYKMTSMVLFLKPVDAMSTLKLNHVFEQCSFKYHHGVIAINPTAVRRRAKKRAHSMTFIPRLDNVSKIIILVTIISILLTNAYACF